MIVVICGMYRSGSTFSFNVAKELLSLTDKTEQTVTENIEEAVCKTKAKHLLIKSHSIDEFGGNSINAGAISAICTIRDPFEAIESYMEVFGFNLEQAILNFSLWLNTFKVVKSDALILDFNEIEQKPSLAILKIANYLGVKVTKEQLELIVEKYKKESIKAFSQNLLKDSENVVDVGFSYYDKNTFFHKNHVRPKKRLKLTSLQKEIILDRLDGLNVLNDESEYSTCSKKNTFTSYAQNFEDVILWRALKHVKSGFYIDVGACSPDYDTVTKAFYERGWWGVNIEPNPQYHKNLQEQRPRDINLKLALGFKSGNFTINFLSNPGLSTFDDTIAKQHEKSGFKINRQVVEVNTLEMIISKYVPQNQEIHFLKVDVEGFEHAVLKGNNWLVNRPWVLVVESTLPMSQIDSYESWEPILLNTEYEFVYADGLNRFYVAKEHSELIHSFKYPPNVFDEYKLNSLKQAEVRAQQAEVRAQQAEVRAQQVEIELAERITQIKLIYKSKSWRITQPLRCFISFFKSKRF